MAAKPSIRRNPSNGGGAAVSDIAGTPRAVCGCLCSPLAELDEPSRTYQLVGLVSAVLNWLSRHFVLDMAHGAVSVQRSGRERDRNPGLPPGRRAGVGGSVEA